MPALRSRGPFPAVPRDTRQGELHKGLQPWLQALRMEVGATGQGTQWPPEAVNDHQLTAIKEQRILVLQSQETEFCHNLKGQRCGFTPAGVRGGQQGDQTVWTLSIIRENRVGLLQDCKATRVLV